MTTWEKIDNNTVALQLEVGTDKVEKALNEAYKKVIGKINVPGFRKGRAPRRVVEARFGPELLFEEVLEGLVSEAYEKALEDTSLEPIAHPDVDIKQMKPGHPLLFEARVEVKPEVELGQYRGVQVEKQEVIVEEDDVDKYLEDHQEKCSRLVIVEGGGRADRGDTVFIDFKGYLEGKPLMGGSADNYSLEIGSETFVPGFEEQLIGCQAGEEKEVRVTFPEDYFKDDLAGKGVLFKVKVNEIKRKEKPALDDDFAKEVSDFDTLEEYRQDIRRRLREEAEKASQGALENDLVSKITEGSSVEAPKTMIERELKRVMNELGEQLKMQGLSLDRFCEMTEKTREQMEEEHRQEAERRVRVNLVLDAIIKKEGFTAEEKDLEERLNRLAVIHEQKPENLREHLERQGQLGIMTKEIEIRKAVDFLVEQAEITLQPPGGPGGEEKTG